MTTPDAESTPPPDDLITAWGLLTEAVVSVSSRLARGLEATGSLSLPEFDVLIRLYRAPARRLPMTRLADDVGLTSGGFTKLTDRMEHAGLIVRRRADDGERTLTASLTDFGRTLTTTALEHHRNDLEQTLLEPLGPLRLQTLTDITRVLRDANR